MRPPSAGTAPGTAPAPAAAAPVPATTATWPLSAMAAAAAAPGRTGADEEADEAPDARTSGTESPSAALLEGSRPAATPASGSPVECKDVPSQALLLSPDAAVLLAVPTAPGGAAPTIPPMLLPVAAVALPTPAAAAATAPFRGGITAYVYAGLRSSGPAVELPPALAPVSGADGDTRPSATNTVAGPAASTSNPSSPRRRSPRPVSAFKYVASSSTASRLLCRASRSLATSIRVPVALENQRRL